MKREFESQRRGNIAEKARRVLPTSTRKYRKSKEFP